MKLKNLLVKESTNTLDAVLAQLPMMAKNGVSKRDMLQAILDASESFDIRDRETEQLIRKYKQYIPEEIVDLVG